MATAGCATIQGVKEGMPDGQPKMPMVKCQYTFELMKALAEVR